MGGVVLSFASKVDKERSQICVETHNHLELSHPSHISDLCVHKRGKLGFGEGEVFLSFLFQSKNIKQEHKPKPCHSAM
jgi:hypothetical protein